MIKKRKYVQDFVTGNYLPVLELNMTSVTVEGNTRPLRAIWTPEMVQDLQAYQGIDAEAELITLLTNNIAQEIDRTILDELLDMGGDIEPQDPIQPLHNGVMTVGEVMEQNERLRRQREIREETVCKWSSLGFLEGFSDGLRENIATLYEGQASAFLNEVNIEPNNDLNTITFPIVRRVEPHLLALDLTILEPISPPQQPMGLYYTLPWLNEDFNWRTTTTWSYGNLYESQIGVKMDLKPHQFIYTTDC